jgi:hypothetical protein
MLPTEVEHKSFQVHHFNEERPDVFRFDELTRFEELHEATVIQAPMGQEVIQRAEIAFKW